MENRKYSKPVFYRQGKRRKITRGLNSATNGFTLLEISIVMVIIGLLMGGGVSMMKMLTDRKARIETLDYLQQVRLALLSYVANNGRLPWADNDNNGSENNGVSLGTLPFLTLQLAPTDAYKRVIRYEVNSLLAVSKNSTCTALKTGLTQRPFMVDADGVSTAFSAAFILVSAGVMDADNSGNSFDAITVGTHLGNNTTGTPNYLRSPPVTTFDDLTTYVSGNEIYSKVCEYLNLAVNNASASTVFVYHASQATDLGQLSANQSGLYTVLSGARVEIRTGAGGSGSIVAGSVPKTPAIFSGQGATINIP